MKYGLIGEHLPHSFSKEIHARIADYDYELCELAPFELDSFMRRAEFSAINVTIPYKRDVIPYLSAMGERAKRIGAVNTVVNRDGMLYGDNTDFYGMRALLHSILPSIQEKKVLVLGTGGTSRTAAAVAHFEGAREVVTVSRTKKEGTVTYDEAAALHADAEIIINTTPVGMFPSVDGTPLSLDAFPRLHGVIDAIYNPLRTNLVLDAMARGIPAVGGLYMLAAQALQASLLFEDKAQSAESEPSQEKAYRIFREVACTKENIVLIGMPSSGKSTVGALLSEQLSRPFIDTDAEIVKESGVSISHIFETEGEVAFRDKESALIERISLQSGAVIATGGGAILRPENLRALRRNGRLYFLDRPLDALMPTSDRPLSMTREAVAKRYEERYPIYSTVCDCHVRETHTPEDAALAIRKDYFR